jgi:hypothetical protein
VVDICATSLPDATTYTKSHFESVAFAAAAAPALDVSLTPPLTKAYAFLEQKDQDQDPEQRAAKKAAKAATKAAKAAQAAK